MNKYVRFDTDEVSQADIEESLSEVWRDLKTNTELRQNLIAGGIDLNEIDTFEEMPFTLEPTEQGFEGVDTFLITVGTGVATHFASVALEYLWRKAIWPALESRFGASVEEADGGSDAED